MYKTCLDIYITINFLYINLAHIVFFMCAHPIGVDLMKLLIMQMRGSLLNTIIVI